MSPHPGVQSGTATTPTYLGFRRHSRKYDEVTQPEPVRHQIHAVFHRLLFFGVSDRELPEPDPTLRRLTAE